MALQMALCVSPHGPLAARSSTRRSLSNRGTGWDAREGPVLRGTSQRGARSGLGGVALSDVDSMGKRNPSVLQYKRIKG